MTRPTALVTGASSGIGAELALELARRGHDLVLVARREALLHELAARLPEGASARVVACDLADAGARAQLWEQVTSDGGRVDLLVNNAGLGTMGPVLHSDLAAELTVLHVNVEALTDLCTRAVQHMAPRRSGSILNVGSTAAFTPMPGQTTYAASKAFVQSYSTALRAEVARHGIAVTCLAPGPVRTGFVEASGHEQRTFDDLVPEVMWVAADAVARAGLDGLERGRATVVPGAANVVVRHLEHHLPRRALVPLVARFTPFLRPGKG